MTKLIKFKKLFALLMTLVMVVCVFAGCPFGSPDIDVIVSSEVFFVIR